MKFWRLIILSLLGFSLVFQSCKKDEEETKNYMTGTLKYVFPEFVEPGYSKSFCIDSLMLMSRDDGGPVGYYYSDAKGKRDTLVNGDGEILKKNFTISIHDTIATLNTTFSAFAKDDYYGSSRSVSFTIVKDGLDGDGSITNFKKNDADQSFVDERDGKKYLYTEIDGVYWMRQNLAWEGAGKAFKDYDVMSDIFGRYYSWEEAQNACPEGWTLPSDEDWVSLGKIYGESSSVHKDIKGLAGDIMGDLHFNGTKMWEFWRDVKITDKAALSVMPAGYAVISDGDFDFQELYKYAALWTADSDEGNAGLRYIYHDKDIVYYGKVSKSDFAANVRCIRKK